MASEQVVLVCWKCGAPWEGMLGSPARCTTCYQMSLAIGKGVRDLKPGKVGEVKPDTYQQTVTNALKEGRLSEPAS